jgi:hypothetical protein
MGRHGWGGTGITQMRWFLRAAATLLALLNIAAHTASAAPRAARTDCREQAIDDLRRLSPRGYVIYEAVTDKKQFLTWVSCDDVQVGLATGVHETVHILTAERDAYPLVDGGSIPRPHEFSKFYAPREIAKKFDPKDAYVQSYLSPGGASSKDDFMYLIDELNAYSHDLNSSSLLVPLQRQDRQVDQRDGLAALMNFVMSYVETAQNSKPATWEGMQHPEPRRVVQTLWKQAETSLASSCGIPNFGKNDRDYIASLCDPKHGKALTELLGRAPVCARECLEPVTTSSISKTQ